VDQTYSLTCPTRRIRSGLVLAAHRWQPEVRSRYPLGGRP
jgi:hypothetical protein